MTKKNWLQCVVLTAFCLSANSIVARETIVLSCFEHIPAEALIKIKAIYDRAFDPLGYDASFWVIPTKRGLHTANSGESDGLCARVKDDENPNFDNLIRINEPVIINDQVSFWTLKENDRSISEIYKLLSEGKVSTALMMGFIYNDQIIEELNLQGYTTLKSADSAIKMLLSGRIDYIITSDFLIYSALSHIKSPKKVKKIQKLFDQTYYPYLNQKHQSLVEPLNKELHKTLPFDMNEFNQKKFGINETE